jgi:hypothetical protein
MLLLHDFPVMELLIELQILRRLRVTPLQVVLITGSAWRGPAVKSLLLRSALGFHLRRRECSTGAPRCEGCPRIRECWYSLAFESPASLFPDAGLHHTDLRVAHPFYLASAPVWDRRLEPGAALPLLLTLAGRPGPLLGRLIESLEEAGRSGRWGGYFHIDRVVSPLNPAIRLHNAVRWREAAGVPWPHWPVPQRRAVAAVRLRFLSPLRLRIRGVVQRRPEFSSIVGALLRRLHVLAALYGRARLEGDWKRPLIRQAANLTVVSQSWRYHREERWSGRQEQSIPIDGMLGEIAVAGDLSGLWPFLDVGQWLGVGATTGHGCGAYVLDELHSE